MARGAGRDCFMTQVQTLAGKQIVVAVDREYCRSRSG